MKRLVVDLDGTICFSADGDYRRAIPNHPVVKKLREYSEDGFEIVISTSRNMRTYEGNIGKINANTLPIITEWLALNDVPYDELIVAKPWCGFEGFYVDDRAVRPSELIKMSLDDIQHLLEAEK